MPLDTHQHGHGASPGILPQDRLAAIIILQRLLFSGAGTDIDQAPFMVDSGPNRVPGFFDRGQKIRAVQPPLGDSSHQGKGDHTGRG